MKNKLRSNLKIAVSMIIKLFVAGVLSLIVLSAVTYIFNYTGMHITNKSGATDYTWQPGQRINNLNEGFAYVQMDENGFNNASVPQSIDILLMGSSHMEAYQVAEDENTGYLLNELLPGKATYNIGVSGHTLYRIADNFSNALKEYSPEEYVLIETSTVSLNIKDMEKILNGEGKAIPSHDSGILYYLQKIPAFKPLYNQLENWIKISEKKDDKKDSQNETAETKLPEGYKEVLYDFLSIFSEEAVKKGIVPVIFYAPSENISENGDLIINTEKIYYDTFKSICEELGIGFVDLTERFEDLYETENVLAHGFPNSAVGTGHLNKHGHRVTADGLVSYIMNCEEK